jgi:Zn finger protein HypA/HybF involved in hydrogenase expression
VKCITCKTKMKCVDDVNNIHTRIDWEECPKCKSKAEIIYGNNGEYINKIVWIR